MNTHVLSERALLVTLTIHHWPASRTDKKITSEVASSHAVSEKRAGRYRKFAINVDAPSYKAVNKAASQLRERHYFYTLPWAQDGARILTTVMHEQYTKEMRGLRAAFKNTVATFVADYPTLKLAAKAELNGMYNEADYPSDITDKFGIEIHFNKLPEAEDFRASLTQDAVEEIQQDIRTEVLNSTQGAMRHVYERLYKHICRVVERLSAEKPVFRDSLVTGLAELCAVMPGLNLLGDPQLDELRRRAERMIANIEAQDLRDNPGVRDHVAQQAAGIQQMMAALMGETLPKEVA